MPHISSKKLKRTTLNKLYREFGQALVQSAQRSKAAPFLSDLLTKTEKIMLAKRFAVIYLLSQDVPSSYIAESLKMSCSTVFRMSLKYDIGKYKSVLTVVRSEKNDLWKILEQILRAGLPPRYGRGRWKFLYEK